MNRGDRFVVLFSMVVVLALVAACGTPQPTATPVPATEAPVIQTDTPPAPAEAEAGITVTFDGDQCVFHGPEQVSSGRIPIVLDVKDQTAHDSYGVQAVTMDEGHTPEELVSYQKKLSLPLWGHDQGFIEAAQGTAQERNIVLFEGPLFLTCFTQAADGTQTEYAGILGPIEIEPGANTAEAASPEPTASVEGDDTTWDMVVLGDSLVADDYSVLPEAYAAHIEEDLGVEVEIQNLAVGGETTRSLLANVQKYPWYREPIQEAEVVLISVGGGDLPGMEQRFFGGESGDCGGADNQDCLRQQLEESEANWDALLDEIASLADPRSVLIRPIIPGILEYYARAYKDQPEEVEVYNSYVVTLYEHIAQSCAERGIPVLDLYALYDGPDADPSLPEVAGTGDGIHVSDEGDAVIADLLRGLGYDPVVSAEADVGITVTFDGEECVYHGPEPVPAGRIPIVLDVRDQTAHELYGVWAMTIDAGHTLEELVPYQEEASFPLWAHDHGFIRAAQGTAQKMTIVLFEGPLFLTCFTQAADGTQTEYAGILGPIEIEPGANTAEAASPEPTASVEGDDTTWDMVVLGDSLVADDYSVLPEAYAAHIEEDLGVEVEIHNLAVGGETTRSLLANVQKYPWYREPIQEAEVILISAGGGDLKGMEQRFFGGESGDCGGADNQECLRQQLEESEANWDALLDEITSLADPRSALIRPIIPGVLEYTSRAYEDQPEEVEVYNSYVVALYEHMAQSCAERGIPVLDLYALYDGPDADPSLPEVAGTGDGIHVSDEGDAVIADLLRGLGYDPVVSAEADVGITVTFDGEECVYHGPERVPAGRIRIILDVRDQTAHESYGLQAMTMDAGHTLEELVPYQEEIRFPLWAHDQGFIEAAQGTTEEQTIVLFEGPLFLSCFTNTADESQAKHAGILGPIEVEPAAPQ